ncbi:MAG: D-2-hydroxyacid dehydrogenase [Myxococcales bacterium]|nr:D-2-hydroxyacid dehydrogenase [Myxococcales bacterium]
MSIFCDVDLPDDAMRALRAGLGERDVRWSKSPQRSNLVASGPDPQIRGAHVVFGQPDAAALGDASSLRWIHLTSAGYTRFDDDEIRSVLRTRGIVLTTSSSVYADPCAEHLLAMILALGRSLPASLDEQRGARRWLAADRRAESRLLRGQRVVVLGFGAIARRLIELLAPFQMEIAVLRREPRGDEPCRVLRLAELADTLTATDHLVDCLPENARTRGFVDGPLLSRLPARARFYNVGRGSTVDETALLGALAARSLDAAYLDVTAREPLARDHPLWSAPRCYLTPHSAGGRADEFLALVEHFLYNLARFETGDSLRDRVI